MNRLFRKKYWLPFSLVLAGIVLLVMAFAGRSIPGNQDEASRKVSRCIEKRLDILESCVADPSRKVPDDMVIYRYQDDSLVKWDNQFPVRNDELVPKMMVQRLSDPRTMARSPFGSLGDSLSYCNIGSGWYLAKVHREGRYSVISALRILGGDTVNHINHNLKIGGSFSVQPLSVSEGSVVEINGIPQFKLESDSPDSYPLANAIMVWMALLVFLAAVQFFLYFSDSPKSLAYCIPVLVLAVVVMFVWGMSVRTDFPVFSPILFSGGRFMFSLGAVVLVNLLISNVSFSLFLKRKTISELLAGKKKKWLTGVALAVIALILLFAHSMMRSIVMNSDISPELYKFSELSIWTFVIYASFLFLMVSIPLLLSVAGFNSFSRLSRIVLSVVIGIYMVGMGAVLGFEKEKNRAEVWANRLSIDRDVSLEMRLKLVEDQIAEDVFIAPLSALNNAASTIRERISETYLSDISQDYKLGVYLFNSSTPENLAMFDELLSKGEPIADGSRFLFIDKGDGCMRYEGVFYFMNEGTGLSRMVLEVEPRFGLQERGYSKIFGSARPGKVVIPDIYAYARYKGDAIQLYKGSFPYPMVVSGSFRKNVLEVPSGNAIFGQYIHFVNRIGNDETVVISRPDFGLFNEVIASAFVALLFFIIVTVIAPGKKTMAEKKSYYRSRILMVLMFSLISTLVVMACASILFVYRRNLSNIKTVTAEKICSLQSMVQDIYGSQDFNKGIKIISANTNSDINIYTPSGLLVMSTAPEMVARTGCRIQETAFGEVLEKNSRYYVQKEKIGRVSVYMMYAPVLDSDGRTAAVISSPYTGSETYDFERDVVIHSMAIITIFLILLMAARFFISDVLKRMFRPLSDLGVRMGNADIEGLEKLEYENDDEITYLVQAYNRMVDELSESTRQLAQAERDKAWSGMARQVAHEIKNPLTPMKLQLQRIIRLKQKGGDEWQVKFDDMAEVILDHIDILTKTANEFSDFAKLYTEEPTVINLDTVLQEEISMFDSKAGLDLDYIGFRDAVVTGPKPQLTRVFINIINNAVQAVDGIPDARVLISLRNSSDSGYYDIVFEDNGPGVDEDNVDKLFVPNFTTKNGGSGLGLAMSKSILEKCSATIAYSRSFTLGGACFLIKYPKS